MRTRARRWPWVLLSLVLILAGALAVAFVQLTRPARLQRLALGTLEALSIRGAEIESVELSIRRGLLLRGVHIPLGPRGDTSTLDGGTATLDVSTSTLDGGTSAPDGETSRVYDDPAVRPGGTAAPGGEVSVARTSAASGSRRPGASGISIGSAAVRFAWVDLLQGRVRPTAIEIDRADVLVHLDTQAGAGEHAAESADDLRRLAGFLEAGTESWPQLSVADAQLVLCRGQSQEDLRGVVRAGHSEEGYTLTADRWGEPNEVLASVSWQPATREVVARSGHFDLRKLLMLLPREGRDRLRAGGLAGQLRVETLRLQLQDEAQETGGVAESGLRQPQGPHQPQRADAAAGRGPRLRLVSAAVQGAGLRFSLPIENELPGAQDAARDGTQDGAQDGARDELASAAGGSNGVAALPAGPGPDPERSAAYLTFSQSEFRISGGQDAATGQVRASCSFTGRVRGAPVSATAQLQAPGWRSLLAALGAAASDGGGVELESAALNVDSLELPTQSTHPGFVRSPQIRGPLWALLNHYEPSGTVNLRARYLPVDPNAPVADNRLRIGSPRLEADVEAVAVTCRFIHFPYQFWEVQGPIRIRAGRLFVEDMWGQHGPARVRVRGHLNETTPFTGFELRFDATDLLLDQDLFAALPEHYQQLWQRVRPSGVCEVVTYVTRAQGTPESGPLEPQVRVEAQLRSGGLTLAENWRVQDTTGTISIDGARVQIHELRGLHDQTRVRLSGEVEPTRAGTRADVKLQLENLPLVHQIAIGAGNGAPPARLHIDASASGSGHVLVDGADRDQRVFALALTGGRAWANDAQQAWSVKGGRLEANGDQITFEDVEATRGPAVLRARGQLPAAAAAASGGAAAKPGVPLAGTTSPWALRIDGQLPRAEEFTSQFVPASWQGWLAALGWHGPADFTVDLGTEADSPQPTFAVDLRKGQFRPRDLPMLFENTQGRVRWQGGRLRIERASAEVGGAGRLALQQSEDGTWEGDQIDIVCSVTGQQIPLNPAFIDGLPAPLAGMLRRLEPVGSVDLDLPRLHVWSVPPDEAGGRPVLAGDVEGKLSFQSLGMRLGLDLVEMAGFLEGRTVFGGEGPTADARFRLDRAQIAGRPLEEASGLLIYSPDDRRVRLEELSGKFCGGMITGAIAIDPNTATYDLALFLQDVAAGQLVPVSDKKLLAGRANAATPVQRRGRIDGEVWLHGRAGYDSGRNGGGRIRVRGASFVQNPVLDLIARLRRPLASDTVEEAWLFFRWEGHQLVFERVDVRNPDVRLVGQGTWNMSTDAIQMNLWAAEPEAWPRLQPLTDVVQFAGQQIVQYRVEGTLTNPRVTPEPLYRLNDVLRRLLREVEP